MDRRVVASVGEQVRNVLEHLKQDREQKAPRFVITTVHGTFRPNATWVEPDAPLGKALREALAPALIDPFRWSGNNSVKARAEAAGSLRAHIAEIRKNHPAAHHALVAHSHGGNVVLQALADPELAEHTLGVVTLGTPFLDAKLREERALLSWESGFMAALFAGIAVFAVGAALGHGRAWAIPGLIAFATLGVALLAGGSLATLMRNHARRLCELMPRTALRPEQLSIVRTTSDEAAAALSGARVAGGCASIFWNIVSGPAERWLRKVLRTIDYLGARAPESPVTKPWAPAPLPTTYAMIRKTIVPVLPILVLSLLDDANPAMRWLGVVIAVLYGLPAIAALLVNVLSLPFTVLFALGLFPCGASLPMAGPYLDLIVEPAPTGTWSVTQLRPKGEDALSHGKSYGDPEVFRHVSDWLQALSARRHDHPHQTEGGPPERS